MVKRAKSTVDFLNSIVVPARQISRIPVTDIRPDPNQPRSSLHAADRQIDVETQSKLNQLADDIASNGLHQPITVKKIADSKYQIVMGERRWRAVMQNRARGVPNSEEIDAIVRNDLENEKLVLAQLAENLQRDDLTDIETATFLKRILDEFPELQKQHLAQILRKSNGYISRILALLDPRWSDVVDSGIITYASLLEQYRALPKEAQQTLKKRAMAESRSLTSGDIKGAREATRASSAQFSVPQDHNVVPFALPKGAGLSPKLLEDVTRLTQEFTPEGENYQYRGDGVAAGPRPPVRQIRDFGGDAVIPAGPGAISPLATQKRELRCTLSQLADLLNMQSFESMGHLVSIMLPNEELVNAINQLGGEVPADDNQLVMALIERMNELGAKQRQK